MSNTVDLDSPYDGHDFYCDEVLSGRREVEKVLETENVLAFKHTKPYWLIHIVVIPKQHIPSLLSIVDPDHRVLLSEMINVIQKVAEQVVADHGAAGVQTNLGSYQDSKHLHWHIHFGPLLR